MTSPTDIALEVIAHGGPDGGPAIEVDFSTNAHPCGPNPFVLRAVREAAVDVYPDPTYRHLCESLALFHGVCRNRIVVGASASELIWRITQVFAAAARDTPAAVITDEPTYGEYVRAAAAFGLPKQSDGIVRPGVSTLRWICSPSNPTGAVLDERIEREVKSRSSSNWPIVVDLAYRPFLSLLEHDGAVHPGLLRAGWADHVAQLWSPNKLHGLTGVRGAYLVLPQNDHAALSHKALSAIAPSWPLGADGVAMIHAHTTRQALDHLLAKQTRLQSWKASQDSALEDAGWELNPSRLHFGLARPPWSAGRELSPRGMHEHLRARGIKLRDGTSFGLPDWVRLSVRPPSEVSKLLALTEAFMETA